MNRLRKLKIFISKYNLLRLIDNSLLVKSLALNKESEAYKNEVIKLKKLRIEATYERIMTYRILIFIITFILLISINKHYISYENQVFINGKNQEFSSSTIIPENNQEDLVTQKIIKETSKICPKYNTLIKEQKYQELVNCIREAEGKLDISDNDGKLTKTIFEKFLDNSKHRINFINIILFLLISILSTSVVNIYLKIIGIIHGARIEREINLMQLITIVLIKSSSISIEKLINIQNRYTKYLKKEFKDCLIHYPINREEAINQLITEVGNEDFAMYMSLIRDILTGDRETSIQLLEAQKNLSFEINRENYKTKVSKYSLLFTFGSFPLFILAIVILFIPIFIYIKGSI